MLYRDREKKKLFHYIVEVAVAMSQLACRSAASRFPLSLFFVVFFKDESIGTRKSWEKKKTNSADCTVCWAHSTKVPGLAQIQRTQNVQDLHAAAACLFFSEQSLCGRNRCASMNVPAVPIFAHQLVYYCSPIWLGLALCTATLIYSVFGQHPNTQMSL